MTFGRPHRHYQACDSTNTRARELAGGGAPHGTVVTAAEQTDGRGRQGRSWTAPPGKALLYSAILRPLGDRPLLPLAVPLAVCDTAEDLAPGIECAVKWPNDVQLDGRKLAGVLIEARPQDDWAVIGVGLNLAIERDDFPPDLRARATSLATVARTDPSAVPFPPYAGKRNSGREALNAHLARWIEADADAILTAWEERDALRDREVAWDGGSGVAGGVDGRGNLVVVVPGGDHVAIGAGEVHLRDV